MGIMNKIMNFFGLSEEEVIERERIVHEDDMMQQDDRKSLSKSNVVSIHSQKNVKVILHEPRSYEEAQQIADHLRSRRSVIVNLQRVRHEQAMRIVDFLSGTVYALNGQIQKIGVGIFICTPDSVELQGMITEIYDAEDETKKAR